MSQRTSRGAGVVVDCDVAVGVPRIPAQRGATHALVLVRVFDEPIGMMSERLPAQGLKPREVADLIVRQFEPLLHDRIRECGLDFTGELPVEGLRPPRLPRFIESRSRVLRSGPRMTVAICTRDRPDGLAALLDSLHKQEYERFNVLVVDNAPSDERTRRLVAELAKRRPIRYVLEPRPGLSRARNRAVESSDDEVIAWADDDATCDRWWAAELARGFVEVPEADAVTGIVVPSELETQSQAWFEHYAGVGRGRGFARAVFSPATTHVQSPLYPLPPFGSGNNMAFRRDALGRIGGFDYALGAGTLTRASEDTAALSSLLWTGGTVVYQPTAIVRHGHRRDYLSLRRQMLGYGRGLSAFYTSMLIHHPDCGLELLRLSRQALRDQFSRRGRRKVQLGDDFPCDLLLANRIGLLQGPFMYAAVCVQARRIEREERRRATQEVSPDRS